METSDPAAVVGAVARDEQADHDEQQQFERDPNGRLSLINAGIEGDVGKVTKLQQGSLGSTPLLHLNLHSNRICSLNGLPALSSLLSLNLSSNELGSGDLDTDNPGDTFFSALSMCPSLTHLDLSSNHIETLSWGKDAAGSASAFLLPSLHTLLLPFNQLHSLTGLLCLSTVLTSLDVRCNKLGSDGSQSSVDMGEGGFLRVLTQLPHLASLRCEGNGFMTGRSKSFISTEVLHWLPWLQSLDGRPLQNDVQSSRPETQRGQRAGPQAAPQAAAASMENGRPLKKSLNSSVSHAEGDAEFGAAAEASDVVGKAFSEVHSAAPRAEGHQPDGDQGGAEGLWTGLDQLVKDARLEALEYQVDNIRHQQQQMQKRQKQTLMAKRRASARSEAEAASAPRRSFSAERRQPLGKAPRSTKLRENPWEARKADGLEGRGRQLHNPQQQQQQQQQQQSFHLSSVRRVSEPIAGNGRTLTAALLEKPRPALEQEEELQPKPQSCCCCHVAPKISREGLGRCQQETGEASSVGHNVADESPPKDVVGEGEQGESEADRQRAAAAASAAAAAAVAVSMNEGRRMGQEEREQLSREKKAYQAQVQLLTLELEKERTRLEREAAEEAEREAERMGTQKQLLEEQVKVASEQQVRLEEQEHKLRLLSHEAEAAHRALVLLAARGMGAAIQGLLRRRCMRRLFRQWERRTLSERFEEALQAKDAATQQARLSDRQELAASHLLQRHSLEQQLQEAHALRMGMEQEKLKEEAKQSVAIAAAATAQAQLEASVQTWTAKAHESQEEARRLQALLEESNKRVDEVGQEGWNRARSALASSRAECVGLREALEESLAKANSLKGAVKGREKGEKAAKHAALELSEVVRQQKTALHKAELDAEAGRREREMLVQQATAADAQLQSVRAQADFVEKAREAERQRYDSEVASLGARLAGMEEERSRAWEEQKTLKHSVELASTDSQRQQKRIAELEEEAGRARSKWEAALARGEQEARRLSQQLEKAHEERDEARQEALDSSAKVKALSCIDTQLRDVFCEVQELRGMSEKASTLDSSSRESERYRRSRDLARKDFSDELQKKDDALRYVEAELLSLREMREERETALAAQVDEERSKREAMEQEAKSAAALSQQALKARDEAQAQARELSSSVGVVQGLLTTSEEKVRLLEADSRQLAARMEQDRRHTAQQVQALSTMCQKLQQSSALF